jgi:large subunit ribosomal protein L17
MRHRKSGRKLNRTWEHRKAMFRNMARSLITHERIRTTVPKAKELSKLADRLVTLALRDDLHARRQAYKILENHQLVKKLFDEIGPRFHGVQGGYTRVVKFALPRLGDAAPMAIIEFTRTAEKQTEQPHESDNTEKIEEVEKSE